MKGLMVAILLALGVCGTSFAAEETPTSLEGVRVVTATEIRPMVEQATVSIYDFRKKASYVEGHVPGAMSGAPYYNERETTLDTSFLPADRSQRIVFYSHGSTGWKSYYAAMQAVEAGYSNVLWMRGGYAEWEDSGLPIAR